MTPANVIAADDADDANRANSTTTLGSTPVGAKARTYDAGVDNSGNGGSVSTFGILNNQIYSPAAYADGAALIDSGAVTHSIKATAAVNTSQFGGLLLRYLDRKTTSCCTRTRSTRS